jgi:two-component system cell cycle response regulator
MGDPEKTTNPSHTLIVAKQNMPQRADSREACLIVIYGEDLGRRVILSTEPLVIGRSSKCDVQIDQENVSRNHTRIGFEPHQYTVRDLGSTNGTYVNDELVEEEKTLRDGDLIKIGRTIFKFIYGNNIEAQYHEEIYRLMTVDGLTDVHNKRYFQEILEKETSRARRYERTFSILMFDIDHFKQINDVHGHLAGDAVLRQLGALVRGRVRRDDIVCRIGGEEFSILLPEVKLDGAVELAKKLRELVERTTFRFESTNLRLTISIGAAQWSNALQSYDDLVKIADNHLYEAKRTGRNRVCY